MPCTEIDDFIMKCLREYSGVTCQGIALKWMEDHNIRYTGGTYHRWRNQINAHMRNMERYGMVRYTGRTVSTTNRSKIWELIQ